MEDNEEYLMNSKDAKIREWVLDRCNAWRDHRDENYLEWWKEYERLWRGVWSAEDRTRDTERSKIITPALQQAVEASVAEMEEAVFGRGDKFFDIDDDFADQDKSDIENIRRAMAEDFKKCKVRKSIADTMLLSAVYGTGIGEIELVEKKELYPDTRPIDGLGLNAVGVSEKTKVYVGIKPINPKNFLIDPTASNIEDALGCAIEEFVSFHSVVAGMESGIYEKVPNLAPAAVESDLEPVQEAVDYQEDKVKLLRYYGLFPRYLLEADEEEIVSLFADKTEEFGVEAADYTELVESIIVIANDQHILKAEISPYMMKDRPVVAYQDDTMPNRFWGRGVAEKGYTMQKATDAQIRAHLDSLALTTAPMMGIDATRIPRGVKFEVKPGKSILTNGNPNEILSAFKFGVTDPGNLQTANEFMRMLLMATGTLDSSAIPAVTGDGQGLNPQLSAIIKKNKRRLVNFQEQFLIPFITKAAWRYMQFDPERYPAKDYQFIPTSNLGIVAREYEQMQFINLLKTLGPDSKISPLIMESVIENSGLHNRETLVAQLRQVMQPNEQEQQQQMMQLEMQLRAAQAQVASLEASAQKDIAEAQKTMVEAQLAPEETKAKVLSAVSRNLPNESDQANAEFDRRVKIAELMLKEADLDNNTKIVKMQMAEKVAAVGKAEEDFLDSLAGKLSNGKS
jgi:hypothetical protein